MKREYNCDYIRELFNDFYCYLCTKYGFDVKASIKTNFEFYKKEFLHKPFNIKNIINIPHSTVGFYNAIDNEITIFMKKEFCNYRMYPVLLHVLAHEYRHKLQIFDEQSIRDLFLFYIEHVVSHFDHNYYISNHDTFYMEIDADKWGLDELNCFIKDDINEFNDFVNNDLEKRNKKYDPSSMFDSFNSVIGRITNNYVGIWGLVDFSLHGFSGENQKKIMSIISDLYNHNGKLSVSPYNIGNLDPELRDIITNSKCYSKR